MSKKDNVIKFPNDNKEVENPKDKKFKFIHRNFYYFYFENKLHKVKRREEIPENITDYVIESRETLNSKEYIYVLTYNQSPDNYCVFIFDQDDSHINDRKAIVKGFLRIKGNKIGSFVKSILKRQWKEEQYIDFIGKRKVDTK